MFSISGNLLTCDEAKLFFKLLNYLESKEEQANNVLVLKSLITYYESEGE